jgi:iron(III) transport system substrate-binding protein
MLKACQIFLSRPITFASALFAAALVAFCGHTAKAQTPPAEGDAVWTYLASLPPDKRLPVLVEQAKREGHITIYGGMAVDRGQIMVKLFNDQYPGIGADYVRLATNEVPQRLMLEYRAHKVNADFMIDGSDWVGLMAPALAPYQPTTWADYDPRFRHGSAAEGFYTVDYDSLVEAIAWRTDRIKSADAPKTLEQVADPKWKGRTGTISSLEHDVDAYIHIYGQNDGMKRIEQLAALENRIYPSVAGLAQALSTGEIDLAWGVSAQRAAQLKTAGAPVDFVYPTPLFGNNETLAVVKGGKHPYAAALMMEVLTGVTAQEKSDKLEPARAHGNTKANYNLKLSSLQSLTISPTLPPDRYKALNKIVQTEFIRRQ